VQHFFIIVYTEHVNHFSGNVKDVLAFPGRSEIDTQEEYVVPDMKLPSKPPIIGV
jgi:hypothetical protein